jgi:hypothetical protein
MEVKGRDLVAGVPKILEIKAERSARRSRRR